MDPARTANLALGFWPARALTAAAELGVLDLLAERGPMPAAAVASTLGLRPGPTADLLAGLAGVGAVEADEAGYRGGSLDPDLLGLADAEAYRAWADLPDAIRTGRRPGPTMFERLADDPDALRRFADAMAAVSAPGHAAVAARLPEGATVLDVGGADGRLARYTDRSVVVFDLPPMAELARAAGVEAVAGDVLRDELPAADVAVLSMVLLDWPMEDKRRILSAVAAALPAGGRLFVVDRMDGAEQERAGTFAHLRSLHLLAMFGDAFSFGYDELVGWLDETGFADVTEGEPVDGGLVLVEAVRR